MRWMVVWRRRREPGAVSTELAGAGAVAALPAAAPGEVAAEQAHLDRAYDRLEALRTEARALVGEARSGDRSGGLTVLAELVAEERAALAAGTVAVLCPPGLVAAAAATLGTEPATGTDALERPVAVLSADGAKGLEFDAVVVLEPALMRLPSPVSYTHLTLPTKRIV